MSVTLQWNGLKEFEDAFGKIPETLTTDASPIVKKAANEAAADVRAAYPPGGSLQGRVTVSTLGAVRGSLGAVVKSNDPIAWLYDNGSQARHYVTVKGSIHETGKMWGRTAPTHLFVRTMIRHRRAMYEELKELLVKHGLAVSGDA